MNKEELLIQTGQRFVSGFQGPELTDGFREEVKRSRIGNVILFSDNITSTEQLNELCISIDELITSETGYHPLITIDQEGGMVSRLPESAPVIPSQMALAALGDSGLVRDCCLRNGRMLKALGCSVNLAPVLDVNENLKNPVIGVRSFSDCSDKVAMYGRAAVEGYKEAGVICCGKHFPGHGDTSLDSHLALPCVDKDRKELESQLYPFLAAIEAGIPAIMTSHILFPKLEKENIPCTMSHGIIYGLLRKELGFKGLVLSDCMEMNAIAGYYGTVEGALRALSATVDLVFISHHAALASQAIEAACRRYQEGGYDEEEWNASLQRISQVKEGLSPILPVCPEADFSEDRAVYDSLAERSITVVKGSIPLFREGDVFVGPEPYITSKVSDKLDRVSFASYMEKVFPSAVAIVTSASPDEAEIREIAGKVGKASRVFFGSYNGHLQTGQLECIRALAAEGRQVVHFALRNPYDLDRKTLDCVSAAAVTYEYSSRIMAAIASLLKGGGRPEGRIPVQLEEK